MLSYQIPTRTHPRPAKGRSPAERNAAYIAALHLVDAIEPDGRRLAVNWYHCDGGLLRTLDQVVTAAVQGELVFGPVESREAV